jgi:hypothetical protein
MDKNGKPVAAAKTGERRGPGRPQKYGRGRISAHVRFTPEMYAVLKGVADRNGRSVSEQVEFLVERHFAETAAKSARRVDAKVRALTEEQFTQMIEDAVRRALAGRDK